MQAVVWGTSMDSPEDISWVYQACPRFRHSTIQVRTDMAGSKEPMPIALFLVFFYRPNLMTYCCAVPPGRKVSKTMPSESEVVPRTTMYC